MANGDIWISSAFCTRNLIAIEAEGRRGVNFYGEEKLFVEEVAYAEKDVLSSH
jgi:hypothetical protein